MTGPQPAATVETEPDRGGGEDDEEKEESSAAEGSMSGATAVGEPAWASSPSLVAEEEVEMPEEGHVALAA